MYFLNRFLIWRPIYRRPVYVGIYLPLAPAHSNYRLETKKHNLKSFCNEKKPTRPFPSGHTQQLHIILLCLHVYTNMRWKRTHLGFSPTDVNNQYSYSYVNGAKRNSHCVAKVAYGHKNYRICHFRKETIHGSSEKNNRI